MPTSQSGSPSLPTCPYPIIVSVLLFHYVLVCQGLDRQIRNDPIKR